MRLWRRRSQHPPREGWVVLLDRDGREVSERIPIVVNCDPLEFTVEHALTFDQIESGTVSAVRVYDIDGTLRDVPLMSGDRGRVSE
jgi:hypothetical protein